MDQKKKDAKKQNVLIVYFLTAKLKLFYYRSLCTANERSIFISIINLSDEYC